jgi:hypothetical protein
MDGWTKDEKAGCLRYPAVNTGTVTQHRAICTNGTCGNQMALTYDRVSGEARQDWQRADCGQHHACVKRILGPLSDFKEHKGPTHLAPELFM